MAMEKLVSIKIKNTFSVATAGLSAKAAEIHPLINNLEDLVTRMQTLSRSTEEFWNGEGADEYRLRVLSNQAEMNSCIGNLRQRVNRLEHIAEAAGNGENDNSSQLQELPSVNIQ